MSQAVTTRRRRHYTRRRSRARLELHWLARAKLGNKAGPHIHWGVGIYDPITRTYIGVFHTTPEHGDHLSTFDEFSAGLEVYRYFYPIAEGAWGRLFERAMHPQPWSPFQNCQHCASYILSGEAHSPTLQAATVAVVSVATIALAAANSEQEERSRRRWRYNRRGNQ